MANLDIDLDFDFGFTTSSEEEIKQEGKQEGIDKAKQSICTMQSCLYLQT
jgi:hypothetical protein